MPKKLIIILLTLGVCLITFFITNNYMNKKAVEKKAKEQPIRVVVAKVPIEARKVITLDMLEYKNIPQDYVIPGALTRPNEAVEKFSLSPIVAGEQIIGSKLTKLTPKTAGLTLVIPENKRAVSVQVDSTASVAGLIKPGDMVDVVCILQELDRTVTILQNVQILAIDQQIMQPNGEQSQNKQAMTSVIATFALDLENSEKLIQAANKGTLKLLLRPLNDSSKVASQGANTNKLLPYTASVPAGGYNVKIINGSQIYNESL